MSKHEITDNKSEAPESWIVSAEELVDQLGYGGVGAAIKVRVHSKDDSLPHVGWAKHYSEFANGPGVVFHDPDKRDWISAVIPLGGNRRFVSPPKTRSNGDPRIRVPITSGNLGSWFYDRPVDPMAKQWDYEILPNEPLTPDELTENKIWLADSESRSSK